MENAVENTVVVSFGHAVWGALVWPMERVELGDGAASVRFSRRGPATWLHVTDPSEWRVLDWKAERHGDYGIVLVQCGEPISLMKHCLSNRNDLNCDDVAMCAAHLGIDVREPDNPTVIIHQLCNHIAPEDPKFLEDAQCRHGETGTPTEVTLLKDPNWHLMEAVYEDMDADDKGEFPEMKSAIKRKKAQHVGLEQQCKRSRIWRGTPKAKA